MFLEVIFELVLSFVFHIPGAFIRWGITGFKKGKLTEYLKEGYYTNFIVFILFIISLFFLYKVISYLLSYQ
jgi:hypothetical protein